MDQRDEPPILEGEGDEEAALRVYKLIRADLGVTDLLPDFRT